MKKLFFGLTITCLALMTGCAAYQVSTKSLSEQLTGNVMDKGYFTATDSIRGNDLKVIKCIDKNGKTKEIAVTNRTGVRIIKNDGSKTTFYANTLLFKDSAIYGSKTHFFNAPVKPIKLVDISRIEIME